MFYATPTPIYCPLCNQKQGNRKISTLKEFVEYKNGDVSLIVEKGNLD